MNINIAQNSNTTTVTKNNSVLRRLTLELSGSLLGCCYGYHVSTVPCPSVVCCIAGSFIGTGIYYATMPKEPNNPIIDEPQCIENIDINRYKEYGEYRTTNTTEARKINIINQRNKKNI